MFKEHMENRYRNEQGRKQYREVKWEIKETGIEDRRSLNEETEMKKEG
jgi:hypothetical protein